MNEESRATQTERKPACLDPQAFQVLYPITDEDRALNGGSIPEDVTEGGCWYKASSALEALRADIDTLYIQKPERISFDEATGSFILSFDGGEDVHGRVSR